MALVTPGAMVSVISGKVGGTVFSRNRGGQYARTHAIPSKVTSARALTVKAAFAAMSQAYNNLDAEDRLAWTMYARENPVPNRIGQSTTLTGQGWFVGLNSRLAAIPMAANDTPPTIPSPVIALVSGFAVDDDPSASFAIASHPDDDHVRVVIYGARAASPGREYVENLFTHIHTTGTNATGATIDFGTELEAALGTIQAGVRYHIAVEILDERTGLVSARMRHSTVAVEGTP